MATLYRPNAEHFPHRKLRASQNDVMNLTTHNALRTRTMHRHALEHVCFSCRHARQAQSALSRTARRYVQISATPSSSEPLPSLEAAASTSSTPPSAGMQKRELSILTISRLISSRRCALRSRWQPFFPPLSIDLRIAEPLHTKRNTGGLQWQSRECEAIKRKRTRGYQPLTNTDCLVTLAPRASSKGSIGHTISIPAHNINHTLLCSDRYQIAHHITRRGTPRWQARLDDRKTKCLASMDRAHLELEADMEHKDGTQREDLPRVHTDLRRAWHTGVAQQSLEEAC